MELRIFQWKKGLDKEILFLLSVYIMFRTVAEYIRSNDNIKGIYIKACFKLNIFADDMTVFLANLESLTLLLKVNGNIW